MIFGTPHMCKRITLQTVKFNNENISRAETMKYLGMKLDPTLTFKEHVNYVKGKTLGKIKLLGKVCSYIKPSTALMLYKSLILPIFDYGDVIYNCISTTDSKTLQVLQNMAFKFILGVPLLTPTAYIHQELEMYTLQDRRSIHSATLMYQVDKAMCPPPVLRLFKRRLEITDRHTRMNVQRRATNARTCARPPVNGRSPVSSSYRITPRAWTSVRSSSSDVRWPRACPGDM